MVSKLNLFVSMRRTDPSKTTFAGEVTVTAVSTGRWERREPVLCIMAFLSKWLIGRGLGL